MLCLYLTRRNKMSHQIFVLHVKKHEDYIQAQLVARGSIPALNKNDIDCFQLFIPPLEIQQEIVDILDHFTKLEAELEAELTARRKQYEYYRGKLLTFTPLALP